MKNYTLLCDESEKQRLRMQATQLYDGPHFLDPFLKKGIKVMDVGCGTGDIARYVANKIKTGQVVAVDRDKDKIDTNVINNGGTKMAHIDYCVGDVYHLAYPDNSFDLTSTRFLLMHLKYPQRAISEMMRVTKPGGFVVAHEGIHNAIWFNPALKHFKIILNAWKCLMKKKGQDHSIGLSLHHVFMRAGLRQPRMQILTHYAQYGDILFDKYIANWKQHIPSFRKKLANKVSNNNFIILENELDALGSDSSLLELTSVA